LKISSKIQDYTGYAYSKIQRFDFSKKLYVYREFPYRKGFLLFSNNDDGVSINHDYSNKQGEVLLWSKKENIEKIKKSLKNLNELCKKWKESTSGNL